MTEKTRQMGNIRILDDRGFCYIPKLLRRELAIEGKGFDIPFFLNASARVKHSTAVQA